jgi:hypothetical protein
MRREAEEARDPRHAEWRRLDNAIRQQLQAEFRERLEAAAASGDARAIHGLIQEQDREYSKRRHDMELRLFGRSSVVPNERRRRGSIYAIRYVVEGESEPRYEFPDDMGEARQVLARIIRDGHTITYVSPELLSEMPPDFSPAAGRAPQPCGVKPRPAQRYRIGDTVESGYHRIRGTVAEIQWSDTWNKWTYLVVGEPVEYPRWGAGKHGKIWITETDLHPWRNGPGRRFQENPYYGPQTEEERIAATPIANPGEFEVDTEPRYRTRQLFRMWFGAYGETALYVWADSFESAFEEAVEWLDDNAPWHLTSLDESDLKEAADDLGIAFSKDMPEEDLMRVMEHAETDLTLIGHTTLEHGEYVASWEWGGDEVTDARELELVEERSVQEAEE